MNPTPFAIAAAVLLSACVAARPDPGPDPDDGAGLFAAHCAACHGAGGRGDGPLAAGLPRAPTDLTRLAPAGAPFPHAKVMSHVHGYFRRDAADPVMPDYSEVFAEPVIRFDSGDGILTATPQPLVALSRYLESLQQPG
ncbi:c-type cytochrome [Limimaricola pyoseonensis]|uniref:Cytochrome c n=1 Tax=Limimaricola pyoseonensis TaxID=521013 RepID=A0A1G7G1J3_9RHOB|nr:c-type cytochrome [Limimaricola pyoseonensis]SDE82054.1 Cytochrome c [Limimaricola pyoseonensis]